MRNLLLIVSAGVLVGGCADVGDASSKLQPGMSESAVVQTIGFRPDTVSLETCGSQTNHPWQCKIYKFNSWTTLWVYFAEDSGGQWIVNNWSSFWSFKEWGASKEAPLRLFVASHCVAYSDLDMPA